MSDSLLTFKVSPIPSSFAMKNSYFFNLDSGLPSIFVSLLPPLKFISHTSMPSSSTHTPDHHEFNPHFFPKHQQKQQQQQPASPSPQPLQATPLHHHGYGGGSGLMMPHPRKTKPIIWFTAVFCAILWVVIIIVGLAVLFIYLTFKPRLPHFDLSSVTLNAAYIDAGSLLNADLTLLANFTNPNSKVSVDFNFIVLQLYYQGTLIATRAIDPFSATRTESRFHTVEMISSQVVLPMEVSERLRKQIGGNGIIFQLRGSFRTRSNFGSLFHYSYWLYSQCTIVVTGPPIGVLMAHKCRTKL